MKSNKLYIDTRPIEQPEGTYPFAKNGIQFDLQGSSFNEPGFRKLAAITPYKPIGIIETDSKPVVFSTNNTNSAIGYFNPETELYEPIIDDRTWNVFTDSTNTVRSLLGFKTDNFITGQSQRNYKNQLITVFTDKVIFPMYLNCDAPNVLSLNDMRLFAFFTTPDIQVVMGSGGTIAAGAYYVAIGYEKDDGTSTQYSAVSGVTIVTPGSVIGTSDKTLQINLSNLDTHYTYARVAIISKVNNITTAKELINYLPITGGSINYTFTGSELTSDIDVSTVLTPPALYDSVGTIGQLNDYLYLGVLHAEIDLDDMQVYANLAHLEWNSQLIDASNPPTEHINGKKKSFMHEEIYAFYIRYRKTRGGKSKWFVIPGPTVDPSVLIASPEANIGGTTTPALKFQVEDCIPYYDPVALIGGFGPWQNSTELYPDTPDFDSSSLGGENLRGKPVRHHKTPSLRWCATNLYKGNTIYGLTNLDLLGVRALGIRIPDKYKELIDGYDIGYAVRSISNTTNYGQGALLHGVTDHHSDGKPTATSPIYTSGGNFRTTIWHHGNNNYDNANEFQTIRTDTFRIHPFDVLFNLPSITPNFISGQYRLGRMDLNDKASTYLEDGSSNSNIAHLVDYTTGLTPVINGSGKMLRGISSSFYCTAGVNVGKFVNYRHENVFCGYLNGTSWFDGPWSESGIDTAHSFTDPGKALVYEYTHIVNLIAIKADLYQNFYTQNLTLAGDTLALTDSSFMFGGDTFLSPYTFHTYGRHNSLDQAGELTTLGIKIARRIVCESASNINLRYDIPGNLYSEFWPKDSLIPDDVTNYLTLMDRSQDPNQFGYSKDFNALNDLIDSTVWNPYQEFIYDFPFRIHRGGKASRTGRPRSWRTFLALDYYEMQKNMGSMVHLEGMDDRLIIHMENALFLTQDKTKLETGPIAVTLGAGDIFQFEPQEALSSKLGYGGTQHELACVRTPFGYIFVDGKQGEVYMYKGKLTLLNEGLNTILRDFLKIADKNVFTGNGITIGWDQKYKRILLTVKNRQLPDGTLIKIFQDTPDFWNNLQQGDIISYQNRYIQYQGVNNTSYMCPPDPITTIITWQPINQYCVLDINGNNTGIKAWADRTRYINNIADGFVEPNTGAGLGVYFPPVQDLTICALPSPIITWQGTDAYCLKNDVLSCPANYTLTDAGCSRTQIQPATPPTGGTGTQGVATKVNSEQWNNGGARIFAPGFPLNGNGTLVASLTTPHFWVNGTTQWNNSTRNLLDSRMNVAGIWVLNGTAITGYTPVNEYIGFSRKVTVTSARTIYIGMAADNDFKFLLNGVPLVDTSSAGGNIGGAPNFGYWNIYPLTLRAGDNYIEMYAQNYGSVAGFAAEIYDCSLAQLQSATTEAGLNIIFTTRDVVGQNFDLGVTVGYSCPSGWSFDSVNVICIKTDIIPPSTDTGDTNNGMVAFYNRCRLTNGGLDGYCEPNTSDGSREGPYQIPVQNDSCLPITPVVPGDVTIVASVTIKSTTTNCGYGTMMLSITFAIPTTNKMKLLIGQIVNFGGTTMYYTGSDIFGSIPDGTLPDPDYVPSANFPFSVNIPLGVTQIDIPNPIFQYGADGNTISTWVNDNCAEPITDIYFKYDITQQDPTDLNTYSLDFTVTNSGITVHNV